MNGTKFNFFTRVANSIAHIDFYKYVVRERMGKAISYLLLLTFLLGLIISIRPAIEFNEGISLFINAFDEKVPYFVLENGELNVDGKMPVTLESSGNIIIIDTSGQTGEQALEKYPNGILFTKHKMIQRNLISSREIDFKQLGPVTITKDMVESWLPFFRFSILIIVVIVPVAFMAFRFFTALVLGIIGLILNSIMRMTLTFTDLFKLSSYALTLPIVLVSLLKAGEIYVPAFGIIYLGVGTIYLWKALNAIRKDTKPTAPGLM